MTENNYHKWLENWQKDMEKHYGDKRKVMKRRISDD